MAILTEAEITRLRTYFGGGEQAKQSIALELGGLIAKNAECYFATRELIGIKGWVDEAAAERAIRNIIALREADKKGDANVTA